MNVAFSMTGVSADVSLFHLLHFLVPQAPAKKAERQAQGVQPSKDPFNSRAC